NQQAQAQLREELEEAQRELRAERERSSVQQSKESGAGQADVLLGVKRLTEMLAEETKRRKEAEQRAGDFDKKRGELEAELTGNQQVQTRLRQDSDELQKQLQGLKETSGAEQTRLEARVQELQSAQSEVEK